MMTPHKAATEPTNMGKALGPTGSDRKLVWICVALAMNASATKTTTRPKMRSDMIIDLLNHTDLARHVFGLGNHTVDPSLKVTSNFGKRCQTIGCHLLGPCI